MDELRIRRLIYVHLGDPGTIGKAIRDCDGVLIFGGEGSGLLHLDDTLSADSKPQPGTQKIRRVPIEMVTQSRLGKEMEALVGNDVPCLVAESGMGRIVIVSPTAVARCQGSVSDLRGKVRFGAARAGWKL